MTIMGIPVPSSLMASWQLHDCRWQRTTEDGARVIHIHDFWLRGAERRVAPSSNRRYKRLMVSDALSSSCCCLRLLL